MAYVGQRKMSNVISDGRCVVALLFCFLYLLCAVVVHASSVLLLFKFLFVCVELNIVLHTTVRNLYCFYEAF